MLAKIFTGILCLTVFGMVAAYFVAMLGLYAQVRGYK